MQQIWSIRVRAHECAITGRPFEDGETFHTAIFFDPKENGYVRRDICLEAWKKEVQQRKPVASWKSMYQKVLAEGRPEITPKESAMELLQRFIEDGDPKTDNARYILALMLERKRQIVQTAEKEIDGAKMLFYEAKKTGEIFIVRDPELRLDEVAQIQDEVATILAFGGPAADAAKAVGVTLTPDGVVPSPDHVDPAPETAPAETSEAVTAEESAPSESADEEADAEPETDEDEPEEERIAEEEEPDLADEDLSVEIEESDTAEDTEFDSPVPDDDTADEDKEPVAP